MKKFLKECARLIEEARKLDPSISFVSSMEECPLCGEPGMLRWSNQYGMKWEHECPKEKPE